jgi:CheY-like chemotaxis protein
MERILVVEDSPESQLMIKGILARNYQVTIVETLEQGRASLSR